MKLMATYSMGTAEKVRERLIAEGIPSSAIESSRQMGELDMAPSDTGTERGGTFWSSLFGGVPESEHGFYRRHIENQREVLSVWVTNDAEHDKALQIMEEGQPFDLEDHEDDRVRESRADLDATDRDKVVPPAALAGSEAIDRDKVVPTSAYPGAAKVGAKHERPGPASEEQVIPVVKEELEVGKTAEERRYRVRTYLVERPVEQTVTLKDERVEIERRPATGEAAGLAQEKEVEVIERHERPVVEKRGRVTEEIVVKKQTEEHEETVSGTVQETKVEIEDPNKPTGAATKTP